MKQYGGEINKTMTNVLRTIAIDGKAHIIRKSECSFTAKVLRTSPRAVKTRVTHKEEFDGAKKGLKISKNVPTECRRSAMRAKESKERSESRLNSSSHGSNK